MSACSAVSNTKGRRRLETWTYSTMTDDPVDGKGFDSIDRVGDVTTQAGSSQTVGRHVGWIFGRVWQFLGMWDLLRT